MSGRLSSTTVAKPWGRDNLPAPFVAPEGERIGEIWFDTPDSLAGLLTKYLFTSEKLSVQVHPSDAQVSRDESGKEECWLILSADPGATIAMGFKHPVGADEMRKAAGDGSIEKLLDWREVRPGDFFYIPANTVHAIGPGLALVEVQQASDITYRLYDYGRPRELHLDEGIRVAQGMPYPDELHRKVDAGRTALLVDGPHFRLAHVAGGDLQSVEGAFASAVQLLPLDGAVSVGGERIEAGGAGCATSLREVEFDASGRCLIAAPLSSGERTR